jgi:type I restriction enzyme S subunit
MKFDQASIKTTLAEVSLDVSYGYTASASDTRVGPKFLRITDIQNGVVTWDSVPFCEITAKQEPKYLLQDGDIVVARTGNSTGENYIFSGNEHAVFASYLIRFRIDKTVAHPRFIWYQMRTAAWKSFVNSVKTGSAQAGANARVLGSFQLLLPDLRTQIAVASILQTIDDRIALFRKTNATLEAIAQALFKSWFVDFDPVRTKAEGREPEGVSAEVAELFPSEFEESEIGLIPKGWTAKSIGDLVNCVGGGTPDTKDGDYWKPAEFAWSTPKDLSGLASPVLLETERKLSAKGLAKVSSGLLPAGTLLMSSRAPIGYLAIAQMSLAVNQGYIAIPPGAALPPLYMLFWCQFNMEVIKNRANGSTFMEISKKAFRPIPAVLPAPSVLNEFMASAEPLFARIVENAKQAQTLAELRDALLPRLISGQLRLNEAEALLQDAA